MKKVVFGISNLNIGGAEKVLVDLVNRLSSEYDITIFTIYGNGQLESKLNKRIKTISFVKKSRNDLPYLYQKLIGLLFRNKLTNKLIYNKYIKNRFDRKIAFLEGPITNLFASETGNIAWVHTDLSKHFKNYKIQKKIYNQYEEIIFVSHDALLNFNKVLDVYTKKDVIYNYLDTNNIIKKSNEKIKDKVSDAFLVVARLVPAKGIDRLIDVSAMLKKDNIDHKICVIGDGPEKSKLEEQIKEYKLENNFFLLGLKTNPYPYIKDCKYFLLPSLYEGFGMTIIEAMVLNKNIIITETGAKEALQDYESKLILKNNTEGIYEGLKKILQNKVKFAKNKSFSYETDEVINKIKNIL